MLILRVNEKDINFKKDYKEHLESLYLASNIILNSIFLNKLDLSQQITLYKYQARITTRPTPFGLFAGVGLVEIGENTKVLLPPKKQYQKHLRLDMNYTGALIKHIANEPSMQSEIRWFPNNTLFQKQNKYRFIEHFFVKAHKIQKLSAVDYSTYLEQILATAQNGALLKDIALSIVAEDITYDEAYEFVLELINNQLLVSELEPTVTTSNNLQDIINTLASLNTDKAQDIVKILKEIEQDIAYINTTEIGIGIAIYEKLKEKISTLGVAFNASKLFQVDMFIPNIKGSVSKQHINDVEKAIALLKKLNRYNDPLKPVKVQFQKLYEENEIPLFDVFDNENGLFYSNESSISPLIDKVYLNANIESEIKIKNTIQEKFTNDIFQKVISEKEKIVKLSIKSLPEALQQYKNDEQMPPTYSTMVRIFKENGQDKIFLETVYGHSAIDLLGRFAHLDVGIEKHIKNLAQQEDELLNNAIIADIVHLPEDRTGNILLRPVLHSYQIPYLAKANVAKEFQIPVSDLMLSLQGNRFVLRSKKLNKEIIPRLSNAHNYSNSLSLPIYKFLCDMQNQNTYTWLGFQWGHLRNYFVFSPRVEFQNVILDLAQWQFNKSHAKDLLEAFKQKNKSKTEEELNKWQQKYEVPNKFLLAEGDNELYINMEDELARKVFVDEIKNKETFVLKEFLMTEDNDTVSGPDGNYAHQFVASFVNEDYNIPKFEPKKETKSIQRKFSLGSEWLYYKIYAGSKTLDHLLKNEIKALSEEFLDKNLIDHWFFIRYTDPDLHIRVRFHFKDINYIAKVIFRINEVLEPLIAQRVIHKLENEIYNREIERYGSNTILLSEQLFSYESQIITAFISLIEGDEGEEVRWLFALKMIDCLLSDFGLSLDEKIEFVNNLKQGFTQEFHFGKAQNQTLNDKYREERQNIAKMLATTIDTEDEWALLFELLQKKSEMTEELIAEILIIKEKNELEIDFYNLLASYTHMALNRLFISQQRLNETAVYFLLEKYYRGLKAYNK